MLGTVTMLRRYPVKSMLGEDVPASNVTGKGLAHDRALALVHTGTGNVYPVSVARADRSSPLRSL